MLGTTRAVNVRGVLVDDLREKVGFAARNFRAQSREAPAVACL